MSTLKGVKPASTAAALKVERERDKAQALRDYEDEQRARQANMARLRELRLAKERAESKATAVTRPARKKTAISTGRGPKAAS